MADNFVNNIRLRRVERRRMMTNVLRAKEDAIGQAFEKHARLD
jgi:hypothetical protein